MAMAAKRIRPNPSRGTFGGTFGLIPPRNPLIQINPQQFDNVKKFDVGHGLPGLDPDVSRQNALSNLSQALQVEFQNQTRNIIRLNNTSSKSSTPHTETPTPKSVIQPSEHAPGKDLDDGDDQNGASDLSRRNSVVTENVLENDREKELNRNEDGVNGANSIENKVNGYPIEDIQNNVDTVDDNRITNDDDLNLEEVMKQRTTANISSIVHDAAQAAINNQQQNLPHQHHVQHQSQQQSQTPQQQQHQQQQHSQQGQSSQLSSTHSLNETQRSQADVLKDNLANMKEEMDSDCELVEDDLVSIIDRHTSFRNYHSAFL